MDVQLCAAPAPAAAAAAVAVVACACPDSLISYRTYSPASPFGPSLIIGLVNWAYECY